jgi:hypothetical protein
MTILIIYRLPHLHGCNDAARTKAYSDFRASHDANAPKKRSETDKKELQEKLKKKVKF